MGGLLFYAMLAMVLLLFFCLVCVVVRARQLRQEAERWQTMYEVSNMTFQAYRKMMNETYGERPGDLACGDEDEQKEVPGA